MERIETSRIEDQTIQQNNKLREVETKTPKNAPGYGARVDVPCCCPGCFSFEF